MIKFADETCKERIIQLIKDMYESPPTDWEDCIKVGLVVPLSRKEKGITSIITEVCAFNYGV